MFRISRFQEVMKGLSRGTFDRLVEREQANKYSKGFGCWEQLLAMVYGQLSGSSSLRQLEVGFNSQMSHHYHLGARLVKRSTLAEANSKRSTAVFAEVARGLMGQVSRRLRRQSEEWLYLLDSTSITLNGPGFDDWTLASRTRRTQGLKVHVLYAAQSAVPVWHSMSAANVNDVEKLVEIPLQKGAVYVFDKGYCDYNQWHRIDKQGAHFVTRFKSNAALVVERCVPIAEQAADQVIGDEIVRFKTKRPGGHRINHYQKPIRRITIARANKDTPLVLATNDLQSSALEIAQRYKDRWQIELFFKWMKQHLKIKQFLGRSENAVRIQILTALISYLLVALYKHLNGLRYSLWECLCLIRATLFQRPNLDALMQRKRRLQLEQWASQQLGLFV